MILVDTSVWIAHFRTGSARLSSLLEQDQVLTHPFVVGELACGVLPGRRAQVLAHLDELPEAPVAPHPDVMRLIEARKLAGTGIGWVDAHLLASSLLAPARLWSLDRAVTRQARNLGVSVE